MGPKLPEKARAPKHLKLPLNWTMDESNTSGYSRPLLCSSGSSGTCPRYFLPQCCWDDQHVQILLHTLQVRSSSLVLFTPPQQDIGGIERTWSQSGPKQILKVQVDDVAQITESTNRHLVSVLSVFEQNMFSFTLLYPNGGGHFKHAFCTWFHHAFCAFCTNNM